MVVIDIRRFSSDFSKVYLSRPDAVRAFCYTCHGGSFYAVSSCPSLKCPLYPYRNSQNNTKGTKIPVKQYYNEIKVPDCPNTNLDTSKNNLKPLLK